MHPLLEDLSKYNDEELYQRLNSLNKKLSGCMRSAMLQDVIPQMQMVISAYQSEIAKRQAKALAELEEKTKNSGTDKGLDGLIDIG